MQMAKELARELVRVEKEKQRRQFKEMRNSLVDLWDTIKNTWMNAFSNVNERKALNPEPLNVTVPSVTDVYPLGKSSVPLYRQSIDFQNSLDEIRTIAKDICPHCGGSGGLRAMQSMAVMGGGTVRGPDTTVKCETCNGKGRVFE